MEGEENLTLQRVCSLDRTSFVRKKRKRKKKFVSPHFDISRFKMVIIVNERTIKRKNEKEEEGKMEICAGYSYR